MKGRRSTALPPALQRKWENIANVYIPVSVRARVNVMCTWRRLRPDLHGKSARTLIQHQGMCWLQGVLCAYLSPEHVDVLLGGGVNRFIILQKSICACSIQKPAVAEWWDRIFDYVTQIIIRVALKICSACVIEIPCSHALKRQIHQISEMLETCVCWISLICCPKDHLMPAKKKKKTVYKCSLILVYWVRYF